MSEDAPPATFYPGATNGAVYLPGPNPVIAPPGSRPPAANESRPTKPARRTRGEIAAICAALHDILAADHPATCRGTFYQAATRKIVGKTEAEYKTTVIRLLAQMRRDGRLPF